MTASPSLRSLLTERAGRKRSRIGIGVTAPSDALLSGLRQAQAFCEPVVYGAAVPGCDSVAAPAPEDALFTDLEQGAIAAAVRGQLSSAPFRKRFLRQNGEAARPIEDMITVLEFPGDRPMLVSPTSNFNTGTLEEKTKLIEASIRFCRLVGLPIKIGLLAQCRTEDLAAHAGTWQERAHRETDRLAELYGERYAIKNYGIDFEKAFADAVTILIEPDGTAGNQVIRTLYFLQVVKFYGAPYMNARHVVVETFRNSRDFPDVMLLAAALANSYSAEEPMRCT